MRDLPLPTAGAPPLLLRMSCFLQRRGIRGGWRLERLLRQRGLLDVAVRCRVSDRVAVTIPLDSGNYDLTKIRHYDEVSVSFVKNLLAGRRSGVTLLDCGADVGLVTARLVGACSGIDRVIAFEPNPASMPYLAHNLEALAVSAEARNTAVADFRGRGELRRPAWDRSDHAAFLEPADAGSVDVETVDSLELGELAGLVLKVDVEGGELQVLRGAARTLAAAQDFCVLFEAHPRQSSRSGVDPVESLRFLHSLRPCRLRVPSAPQVELDLDRSFWDQLGVRENVNVCAYTGWAGDFEAS